MGWNGSGTVNRNNGVHTGTTVWAQDAAEPANILSTRHDTHDEDLADAIENCVAKDGQNTATANLPMGTYRHTNVGAASARTDYARASQAQDSAFIWGSTAGGTANALTCSLTPAVTAYSAGLSIHLIAASDNTGSATLNVNSVGANTIKKIADASTALSNLENSDITQNMVCHFVYNGSNFVLLNPSISKWVSFTPTLDASGSMTYTSTSISYAKYFRQGTKIFFAVDFTGTVGGTVTGASVRFTLPATAAAANFGGGCQVSDGTGKAGYWSFGSTTSCSVNIYTGDWSAGSGRAVRCQGFYETA